MLIIKTHIIVKPNRPIRSLSPSLLVTYLRKSEKNLSIYFGTHIMTVKNEIKYTKCFARHPFRPVLNYNFRNFPAKERSPLLMSFLLVFFSRNFLLLLSSPSYTHVVTVGCQ